MQLLANALIAVGALGFGASLLRWRKPHWPRYLLAAMVSVALVFIGSRL